MMSVVISQPCPACKGFMVVGHPDWADFIRHFKQRGLKIIDMENGVADAWFAGRGHLFPPAQKIPCTHCRATGLVNDAIPLDRFIQLINQQEYSSCRLH